MKHLNKLFLSALIAAATFSCNKEGVGEKWDGENGVISVTAQLFNSDVDISKMHNATVVATDINTMNQYKGTLNENANALVSVPLGVYNISIESGIETIDGVEQKFCATHENFTVSEENQELLLTAYGFPTASNNSGFIISELFFNGETNNGRMMHPDQYIVIYNSSLTTLYADGLSFATTSQGSASQQTTYYASTMPKKVAVTGVFTIPGSGTDVAVEPGGKIVIAMTAQDHSKPYEGYTADDWYAVDLSGADFEFYQVSSETDTDNPDVPNLIVTDGVWGAGANESLAGYGAYMHPRGFYNAFIFKLEKGDTATVEQFFKDNNEVYTEESGEWYNLLTVPADMILDGIVTIDNRAIVTRPLPDVVDKGYFQVSGCHSRQLAIRKTIEVDGITYYQDTNDSTSDFPLQQTNAPKQNAYPIGWRDAK